MKKSLPMLWAAVAACASADADTAGLERVGEPVVAGEVSASFVNKVLSYGLVDGDEPLFLPSGSLTFFGWYSAGAIFYMDMTDGGRTWTKAAKAWDWPWTDAEKRSATDPSLVVDGKAGKIFLFYTGREFVKGDAPNEFFVQESSDNGRTWTKPRELTKEIAIPAWPFGGDDRKNKANIFIPSGSGTQLKDGTLVHTITWASKGEIALLASRDHGKSWFIMGKPVRAGNECKVVELADGSLMVNSRYYATKRYVVESKDRGETWTCRWDAALVDPMCNAQLMRVGRHLVFSNCRSIFRRNLFVRASADEGRTWNEGVCISPDGTGYSDITVLPNGDLGVLYEGVDYATIEFVTLPMKAVCGEDPEAL